MGRCDHCREFSAAHPGCCDEEHLHLPHEDCNTLDTCDTTVEYCIRNLRSTEDDCPVNQTRSSGFAFEDFNIHRPNSLSFFGLNLPIVITSESPWTVSGCTTFSMDSMRVYLMKTHIIRVWCSCGTFLDNPGLSLKEHSLDITISLCSI